MNMHFAAKDSIQYSSPNFLANEPVLEYIFGVMELSLRTIYFRLPLCASVVLIFVASLPT